MVCSNVRSHSGVSMNPAFNLLMRVRESTFPTKALSIGSRIRACLLLGGAPAGCWGDSLTVKHEYLPVCVLASDAEGDCTVLGEESRPEIEGLLDP